MYFVTISNRNKIVLIFYVKILLTCDIQKSLNIYFRLNIIKIKFRKRKYDNIIKIKLKKRKYDKFRTKTFKFVCFSYFIST